MNVRPPDELVFTASQGEVDIVRILLENGWDVNARTSHRRTAIFEAARENPLEVVQLLIEYGVDVNATQGCESALHCAARNGYHDMIMLLMDAGARDLGYQSATDIAMRWQDQPTISLLSSYRIPARYTASSYDVTTVPALMPLIHNFRSDIWRMVKWMLM
jgi:ankyrin repeat protein